jgi:uncharacterized protein YigE (DUF2233 family)
MVRIISIFLVLFCYFPSLAQSASESTNVKYFIADPKHASINFYWKDQRGVIFRSLSNVKSYVEANGASLLFAMNGGMYRQDNTPQGLYIEKSRVYASLDTLTGAGNFYLKPNGVFYITKGGEAVVCESSTFRLLNDISHATQSGPMLLIDGAVHPAFKQGSANLNVRNGVGILPDGKIIFAISTAPINFYDFAMFFKSFHCKNALYLDGFVSRAYFSDQDWKQLDGNFGVIIGVSEKTR